MNKNILSILVPTYNRANRLEIALSDLLRILGKLTVAEEIELIVSDNGSTDATGEVIEKYILKFQNIGVNYRYRTSNENKGFDANIENCVKMASGDYIWFLSDDDNIIGDSISTILRDIKVYNPSAIIYNFNQLPYNYSNPLFKQNINYMDFMDSINKGLADVMKWPKLSTIVVRRNLECLNKVEHVAKENPGFMHIAILLQTVIDYGGNVLQKKDFIAEPDIDYMNNIDFMPNIGDNIVDLYQEIMVRNNLNVETLSLELKKQNPTTVVVECIYWISEYYRGKMSFKLTILKNLKLYINSNLRKINPNEWHVLIKPISYLLLCKFINMLYIIFYRKKLNKIRN